MVESGAGSSWWEFVWWELQVGAGGKVAQGKEEKVKVGGGA